MEKIKSFLNDESGMETLQQLRSSFTPAAGELHLETGSLLLQPQAEQFVGKNGKPPKRKPNGTFTKIGPFPKLRERRAAESCSPFSLLRGSIPLWVL